LLVQWGKYFLYILQSSPHNKHIISICCNLTASVKCGSVYLYFRFSNCSFQHYIKQQRSNCISLPQTFVTFDFGRYRISQPIRRNFFPEKCDLNLTCILFAEGKYYFWTYKYPYNYYTTSLSWDSKNNHEDDFSGSDDDFLGFCDE